ncbi:PREDICTED: uncharacterized protein LOC105564581 [Vollenhovia emeryi]|uniref:uncharacterized protein LOC105564581 n=1 Tax=Vollenhovia emeryi TaxID=411798 RepID=UPI0005F3B6A9|nr:PREDICTED: uncharacterized protein LOC105564581 [Vollenhovia emeryi]XP_011872441.1 PREDICTED: uncharacterized protein LOC105564581 [Vollenhovia emeryi]
MEVEEWLRKHYTQECPNTVKCNRCDEIFSNQNRLQILKYHLYEDHEITELDGHPEREIIQQNYKITCLTATCNHCRRKSNLAIYGVHILIIHLRTIHSDKYNLMKRRRSRIWEKYDKTDDKAICKQCKTAIKINSKIPTKNLNVHLRHCRLNKVRKISHLWDKFNVMENKATCKECKRTISINSQYPRIELTQHLILYCRYFKNYHLDKCKLKEMQRRSRIWNKYEVTDNKATCRKCKGTITINSDTATTDLSEHLLQCRYSYIDNLSIGKLKNLRRSHIWEKFDCNGDGATCKQCKRNLVISGTRPISYLRSHLKYCRSGLNTTEDELKKLRRRSLIWEKFDEEGNMAICKQCKRTVSINKTHPTIYLRMHLKNCRGLNITKDEMKKLRRRSVIWEKFDEEGNKTICKQCKRTVSINETQPTTYLRRHLNYCRSGFNLDAPKVDTFKKSQRRSLIWEKFDEEENRATCKQCKKTLSISGKQAILNLRRHLKCCSGVNLNELSEDELKKLQRRSVVWEKFDEEGDTAICKQCKKSLTINDKQPLVSLRQHLKFCRGLYLDEDELKKLRRKSQIWEKFHVYGDRATCKQCKRTVLVSDTRPAAYLRRHLQYCRSGLNLDEQNKVGMKKLRKGEIWEKFDKEDNMAICKQCKKPIKLGSNYSSKLRQHLSCCRGLNLNDLSEDELKKLRRKSQIWEKFDENGDRATCKQCTKTIKMQPKNKAASLHLHLHYCRGSNLNDASKDELKKSRRTSKIWEKFYDNGDIATCKQCTKTIKLKPNQEISYLYYHFHACRGVNLNDLSKDELKKLRRRSQVWGKFDINGDSATCKQCTKTIKVKPNRELMSFHYHLRNCRGSNFYELSKYKLKKLPRRKSQTWEKFEDNGDTATCKQCTKTIKLQPKKQVASLHHHLNYCRGVNLKGVTKDELRKLRRRSKIWEKFDDNGNSATCKQCTKTIKLKPGHEVSSLHFHIRYCRGLDLSELNEDELKKLRRRSVVWEKFDEEGDKAICKLCKKTLSLSCKEPVTNLRIHLQYCRGLNLGELNNDELKKLRRRSVIWEKFDEDGDNAVCKQCQKTLLISDKKQPVTNLRSHLKYCRGYSIGKVNEDKLKKLGRRSHIWLKFVEEGNRAICKQCKKKVLISGARPASNLWSHLQHCRSSNITELNKDKVKKSRKKPQIWEKFHVDGNRATCKQCKGTVLISDTQPAVDLRKHLRLCHCLNLNEDELKKSRRRSQIWEKFYVDGNRAICKQCKRTVLVSDIQPAIYLRVHLRHCRGLNLHGQSKDELKKVPIRLEIWEKFDKDGNRAICKLCRKSLSISGRDPKSNLRSHLACCRGKSCDK